jgi:hypothetical protein
MRNHVSIQADSCSFGACASINASICKDNLGRPFLLLALSRREIDAAENKNNRLVINSVLMPV